MSRTCGKTQSPGKNVPIKTFDNGRRALLVNGIVQSVHPEDAATGYWSRMLPDREPENALLLGFGGGTVARLLQQRYGPIAITGIDNSEEMLSMAQDFGPPISNLLLLKADALLHIHRDTTLYDFIAVDLFKVDLLERRVLALPFLRALSARLNPGGTVAFNLFQDPHLNEFVARLERVFEPLRLIKIGENAVFHGHRLRH